MSVSDEARAEVNGLKASHFFSLAERLNVGAAPFIWLFIRPPWSVSGSCCKAVVHESLRAECQLQRVSAGSLGPAGHGKPEPKAEGGGTWGLSAVLAQCQVGGVGYGPHRPLSSSFGRIV